MAAQELLTPEVICKWINDLPVIIKVLNKDGKELLLNVLKAYLKFFKIPNFYQKVQRSK